MRPTTSETTCSRCGCAACPQFDLAAQSGSAIPLSPAMRSYLNKTFYARLCQACLLGLDRMVAYADQQPIPVSHGDFEEGVHFTREKGLWVFSELYHIMKGYCCRSGCKNCAYGFTRRQA